MNSPAVQFDPDRKHFMEFALPPDAFVLDTARYYSNEFKALEEQALWFKTWQMACQEADVARAGDWYEFSILNQSYVVVRDTDNTVRAFHNVCRHRGNQLCVGSGNGKSITCPYHLWQYNLDGSLKHVSDRETFISFSDSDYGLKSVPCATWGGFVFINPDPDAEPLIDYLGPLPGLMAPFNVDKMVPVGMNVVQRINCNWKIGIEAFSESYHVQGVHPQNLPMVNDYDRKFMFFGEHRMFQGTFGEPSPRLGNIDTDEVVEAFGIMQRVFRGPDAENPMETLVAPYRDKTGEIVFPEGISIRVLAQRAARERMESRGVDTSQISDEQLSDNWNFMIFPNLTINIQADVMNLFRFMPDPDGDPEVSMFEAATFQLILDPEEAKQKRTPRRVISGDESMGFVVDQDRVMMPRQQKGLRSRGLDHVILSRQEIGIVHFHHALDARIAGYLNRLND